MSKWLGDGKLIAAAILAAGVAMVAVPAFGESGGGGGGTTSVAAPKRKLPPRPMAIAMMAPSSKARKQLDKTAECMRSHAADIPGAKTSKHGFFIGPDVPRSAVAKAAKECGAPAPPPEGALPPLPMGAPGERGKFDAAVGRCLHARAQR
jgi:hypothetical protein